MSTESAKQHGKPQGQPQNAATGTHGLAMAVWEDCGRCKSTGRTSLSDVCTHCLGLGKQPTFIPFDELVHPYSSNPDTVRYVVLLDLMTDWVHKHDAAVNELAADLDASGLVPEMPAPGREMFAQFRDHLTVSGTFQSDKYKWCPAGFVPLKLTDPAARDLLAIYAVRRKPIDKEFPRDLIEALANVPEKPNPKYGPMPPLQSKPSADLPEAARHLLDVLIQCHFWDSIKGRPDLVNGRCGGPGGRAGRQPYSEASPDVVQAQGEDGVPCLCCCGTGNVLFWNGSQPCGDCNGSGVQPAKEGESSQA